MTIASGPRPTSPPMSKPVLLGTIGALLVVVALAVFGLTRVGRDGGLPDDSVLTVSPGRNDKILQQGQIKVELMAGWDATLTIDQREIPREQLVRNVDERFASYQTMIFQPGPGKVFEEFPAGQNCATVTYWPTASGPGQSHTRTWCFTAF